MNPASEYLKKKIEAHLAESAMVKQATIGMVSTHGTFPGTAHTAVTATAALPQSQTEAILNAAKLVAESFRSGGKLLLCGNGGSAADCQHVATEFTNILDKHFVRPPLPAIALTTDSSFLTAFSNDFESFSEVFAQQIRAIGKTGDALIGISTSGSSENVIRAVKQAKALGIKTVVLTGRGGKLADIADVVVAVPSERTAYIQEAHLAIEHAICDIVEDLLYKEKPARTFGDVGSQLV